MELYNIQNLGIINRIWKRCGTGITTYPIKNVISDLNDALDWYFHLAFKSGINVDDLNQTLPPLDTYTITSGTNRYKLSAFTQTILNLIKLEILDSNSYGHELYPEDINNLPGSFESLYLWADRQTGIPIRYCKYGDFIYLRPTPDYTLASALKVYFNRPASKFQFVSATVTIATPGVFTSTGHGLVANDTVILETDGALPTGLSADTVYYVISTGLTADDFRLSATLGGSAINTTGSQSGNHYFLKINSVPGIMETHYPHIITYVSKTFLNDNNQKLLGALPTDVLIAEKKIMEDYSLKNKDERKIMTFCQRAFR